MLALQGVERALPSLSQRLMELFLYPRVLAAKVGLILAILCIPEVLQNELKYTCRRATQLTLFSIFQYLTMSTPGSTMVSSGIVYAPPYLKCTHDLSQHAIVKNNRQKPRSKCTWCTTSRLLLLVVVWGLLLLFSPPPPLPSLPLAFTWQCCHPALSKCRCLYAEKTFRPHTRHIIWVWSRIALQKLIAPVKNQRCRIGCMKKMRAFRQLVFTERRKRQRNRGEELLNESTRGREARGKPRTIRQAEVEAADSERRSLGKCCGAEI